MARPGGRNSSRAKPGRPRLRRSTLALIALLSAVIWWAVAIRDRSRPVSQPLSDDGYLFLVWNVENLFDDRDDPSVRDEIEDEMGRSPALVAQKIDRLVDALLVQNGGLGPDLLGLVEVENPRVLERLREALNRRLPEEFRYRYGAIRENFTGRHLTPALLSRLPIGRSESTRDFGARRVLEAPVLLGDSTLILIVTHWTSRVTDKDGEKRDAYGDLLYRHFFRHWRDNPAVDLLIAGDFNDEPGDPSVVDHLRAVDGRERVVASAEGPRPWLLNLTAAMVPTSAGTYRYRGRWEILDQIVVSPGLLDKVHWEVKPSTLRIHDDPGLRRGPAGPPWTSGRPSAHGERGYSDHFAVSVRLRFHRKAPETLLPSAPSDDRDSVPSVDPHQVSEVRRR